MKIARRSVLRLASLLACPSTALAADSDSGVVHAILAEPASDHRRAIEQALVRRFARLRVTTGVEGLDGYPLPVAYLAIGPVALQSAMTVRLGAPLIGAFTSRQSFMRATVFASVDRRATAIYAEPSPAQQMRLIRAIFKRTVKVGVLLSEQSGFMEPLLRQAAEAQGQELELAFADLGLSLSRNLLRLASATVILIFPDTPLYTQASLHELLEITYRRRQPVVGFSDSLVAAGTLASAYADIDDTLTHLQAVVADVTHGRLPAPQYPRYWRVAVNNNVARSLNVVVDAAVHHLGDRP